MKSKPSPTKSKTRTKKDNENKNDLVVKIGIIIITVVFIAIIYKIFNIVILNNEKIDLSGETYYQYFQGLYEEYSGKMEIVTSNQNKQLLVEDGRVIYLYSTPIYYKDTLGKLILPNQMMLINTANGSISKLEEYTNIIQNSKTMYAKKFKKENKKNIDNSVIFDGNDVYLFLEETTITIGKKKYKLSPLSYAIVNYRQNVEFYDYDKNEYIILDEDKVISSDVIATNKNKDYTMNLSIDSLSTGSSEQLLINNINDLNKLDY